MQPVVSIGACSIGRGLIALFEDVVGFGKTFLDVAEAHLAAFAAVIEVVVAAVVLVDDRRAGLQRLLDVEAPARSTS